MDFNLLMPLRRHLTVAHHVPGRIRIKFGLGLLADPQAGKLMDEARKQDLPPAVRSTRLNPLGRSVVIEYDPETLPPAQLAELLTTKDAERFTTLARELSQALGLEV
ncbi:MAG: hypothetical protein PHX58_09075 [Desulfovibrio sp.]|nr:hypothetical protein [Desulfovibrio sp.]